MPARIRSATSTARAQVARLDEDLAAAPEDNRRLREDKLELQKEKDQMRKQRNEALSRAQKAEKLLQEKTAKINHKRKLLKAAENKTRSLKPLSRSSARIRVVRIRTRRSQPPGRDMYISSVRSSNKTEGLNSKP